MFHAFSKTLATIALILMFSVRMRSSPVIGLLPSQSVSPLKDPEYVSHLPSDTRSTDLTEHDADDTDRFWHCGRSPKIMTIEVNDLQIEADYAEEWKYYNTVHADKKWTNTNITYSVFNYGRIPKDQVTNVLRRALRRWSNAAPRLHFTQLADNAQEANFRIQFVAGAFQNPQYSSHLVAHAFFPEEAAERMIEIRDTNRWVTHKSNANGHNLHRIATHEFGHALGLYHTQVEQAIMYEFIRYNNIRGCKLHADDIAGIQSLYGGSSSSAGTSRKHKSARSASFYTSSSGDDDSGRGSTGGYPLGGCGMIGKMKSLIR